MIYLLLDLVFYFGCALAFVHAEPIILLKIKLGFDEDNYDSYNKYKQFIHRLIYCLYCSSFWITLILSLNFKIAIIVSVMAFIWDNR